MCEYSVKMGKVTTTDDETDFTPVVKISSKYQPDLDLSEYYNEWRNDAGPEMYARDFRETSPQFHSRYPEEQVQYIYFRTATDLNKSKNSC